MKHLMRCLGSLTAFLLLFCMPANAWEWHYALSPEGDYYTEVKVTATCEECGEQYEEVATCHTFDDDINDVIDELVELVSVNFCDDCGGCTEEANSSCYRRHHCHDCGLCINEPYCQACYDTDHDFFLCSSCGESNNINHCTYCNQHLEADVDCCECEVGIPHCTNCSEVKCKYCGVCLVIAGEMTEFGEDACMDHEICMNCLEEGVDPEHCLECTSCDDVVCDQCGLCSECNHGVNHCPLCDFCYGYGEDVDWCASSGEHCRLCCEGNGWLCPECGGCIEGLGLELCEDCGLCEACGLDNSEDMGCTHGYCVMSSEYILHVCPNCDLCPNDGECEYCGFCETCQADYHCEHEVCPEGPDWDEHLCSDCGDCFNPDELCEYCGRCEDCASDYHCQHGLCPDDSEFEDDHFICDQCGECYEGSERCEDCKLFMSPSPTMVRPISSTSLRTTKARRMQASMLWAVSVMHSSRC